MAKFRVRPSRSANRSGAMMESVEPRLLMSSGSGKGSGKDGGQAVASVSAISVPLASSKGSSSSSSSGSGSSGSGSSGSSGSGSSSSTRSGDKSPMFDFNDAFYLRNGIDPTKIAGRPNGTAAGSVVDAATDPTRRNVRLTAVVGGHDDNGKPILFNVLGTIQATAFTNDAAGREARQIADKYIAYIFPKAGSNPLSPAQKRQDELIPLNNGYFSNDPTQIWREAFVNYVPAALNTSAGKKVAQDLLKRNGPDADGTPMIRTMGDLDKAKQAGLVTVRLRADDGSQGAPWFFCAVYKDPRDGAIRADNTLAVVKDASGNTAATSKDIEELFNSVKAK